MHHAESGPALQATDSLAATLQGLLKLNQLAWQADNQASAAQQPMQPLGNGQPGSLHCLLGYRI